MDRKYIDVNRSQWDARISVSSNQIATLMSTRCRGSALLAGAGEDSQHPTIICNVGEKSMCPWKAAKVTEPKLSLESGALCCCRPAFRSASRKTHIILSRCGYDQFPNVTDRLVIVIMVELQITNLENFLLKVFFILFYVHRNICIPTFTGLELYFISPCLCPVCLSHHVIHGWNDIFLNLQAEFRPTQ